MLTVRVAAALARTLPRRAGFVSIIIKLSISNGYFAESLSNINVNIMGVKGNVNVKAASCLVIDLLMWP